MRPPETDIQARDLAWGRNAIAFIRERDLDGAFNDWCGGWPCPVDTAPATEIGRLVARILEIAPSAGLFAEISIKPALPSHKGAGE